MRPYYEHAGITIYHGDCREVLAALPDGVAAAGITDPPYNVGLTYGDGTNDSRADYEEWCREWFGQLRRVVSGAVTVSCGVANVGLWERIEQPTWWLAWHKPAAMGRCTVGFNNWEPIALYGRPLRPASDVIRAPITPDASVVGHPCPKPVMWAAKQIEILTPPGALVLDPFAGSGTTGVVALRHGRRFLGLELNPAYAAMARRRIAGPLFAEAGA